jgi:hypothetical protein
MRRYIEIFITVAFLGYGLIRLGVGSFLLAQVSGLIDFQAFHGPIVDIGNFLSKSEQKQIIPVSIAGYVSYIALMGVILSTGALRALKNKTFGLSFIAVFIIMYILLFVNFQTINPKAIHLGICIVLFGVLIWFKGANKIMKNRMRVQNPPL